MPRPVGRPRRTHCHRGHEFTPENTKLYGTTRICIACVRIRTKRYYKLNRQRQLKSAATYYQRHKERIKAYKAKWWRDRHPVTTSEAQDQVANG